jgi:hypothetical protein
VRSLRRSTRFAVTEHGMAYGARALRLRSPNSSRERDASPGRTRESSTGRSGTGDSIPRHPKVREMRNADTVLGIIQDRGHSVRSLRWTRVLEQESLESHVTRKAVMRGSEEGRWKSTHRGNSLAAYPTSCTVLRAPGGGIPPGDSPGHHLRAGTGRTASARRAAEAAGEV